jgi:hypothetical protein
MSAEGFGWHAEVRSQRSEVGGRRSEVGGRRSEVGGQKSEAEEKHASYDWVSFRNKSRHVSAFPVKTRAITSTDVPSKFRPG